MKESVCDKVACERVCDKVVCVCDKVARDKVMCECVKEEAE